MIDRGLTALTAQWGFNKFA